MNEEIIIWANIAFGIGLAILGAYSTSVNPILAPFSLIITLVGAGMMWSALNLLTRRRLGESQT